MLLFLADYQMERLKMKTKLTICITIFTMTFVAGQLDGHVKPLIRSISKELPSDEQSIAQLYQDVQPSVVTIFTSSLIPSDMGLKRSGGLGTGILISGECHILTAAHVVAGNTNILVKTQDGKIREATVLFTEKTSDIALLKLDYPSENLTHAVLGDSDQLSIGQNIYAIGNPYGLENSFSSGVISAFRGFNTVYNGSIKVEFIQTDAALNSGNSGGPLFNSRGEVVGIASSILTISGGFQGIGMGVTINTAKDLLAFENRPWVGIDGILFGQQELADVFNLKQHGGILVQTVAKNSPAEKAGIKAGTIKAEIQGRQILLGGDIILSIGNQKACHVDCLDGAEFSTENMLEVKYLRNGIQHTAIIDVSEVQKNFLKPNLFKENEN